MLHLIAAGVLAHMASDGEKAWTIKEPERDRVLSRMVRNINRFDASQRHLWITLSLIFFMIAEKLGY